MKKKVLIVVSDYYKDISDALLKSTKKYLNKKTNLKIIKSLKIKNLSLVTRSPKKVVGLEGFDIKIVKQEIIKWKKEFL